MSENAEMLTCGKPCESCPIAELRNRRGDVVAMQASLAVDHAVVEHGAEMTSQTPASTLIEWSTQGAYSQGIEPGSDAGIAAASALMHIARQLCSQNSIADF